MRYASPQSSAFTIRAPHLEFSLQGRPKHLGVKCKTQLRPIPVNHSHPALPRNLLGSSNMSAADANKEMPATASPPYKPIQPVAYGPANPPRFASELTKAIPEAAANPVRKSPGSE